MFYRYSCPTIFCCLFFCSIYLKISQAQDCISNRLFFLLHLLHSFSWKCQEIMTLCELFCYTCVWCTPKEVTGWFSLYFYLYFLSFHIHYISANVYDRQQKIYLRKYILLVCKYFAVAFAPWNSKPKSCGFCIWFKSFISPYIKTIKVKPIDIIYFKRARLVTKLNIHLHSFCCQQLFSWERL